MTSRRARLTAWLGAATLVAAGACSRSQRASTAAPTAMDSSSGAVSAVERAPPTPSPPGQSAGVPTSPTVPSGVAPTGAAPQPPGSGGGPPPPRGGGVEPRAGTSNPFDDHARQTAGGASECTVDRDCVCGVERSTGACAVGPASRVDDDRPCPDFCTGVDGRTRVVCEQGRCAQTR